MDKKSFLNKSHCQLNISSQKVEPEILSKLLNIEPFQSYRKGDAFTIERSGIKGKRFQNLWSLRSDTIITENEDLSPHLKFFRTLLESKLPILFELKNDPQNEISFWIWIETDNAGIGFDLSDVDLFFINSISNRVHISVLTNQII